MNLLGKALRTLRYSLSDYQTDLQFTYANVPYQVVGAANGGLSEIPANNYLGYVRGMFKANSVVFSAAMWRMRVFSEARFQFQRFNGGQPGALFGSPELGVLERPWPNGTTGELLARMELDATLAGNFFAIRERDNGDRLRRLRPDWVTIVLSAPAEIATRSDVIGYQYQPGGPYGKGKAEMFDITEVAHWSPIPDPEAQYRGMSWLTPVVREVMADKATTEHKRAFFDNSATPQMAVTVPPGMSADQFKEFIEISERKHTGVRNAYKTLYLGGGADVKVVGKDLQQLDFALTAGAGELRIVSASGVPASLLGALEGLKGSSLNAGNFDSARRSFADGTMGPLWRSACASLEVLLAVPSGAQLWYDTRGIPFLRDDRKDVATVQQTQALAIKSLVDAGYEADSVVKAVIADDYSLLVHSGLFSVQLQPPGSGTPAPAATPAT